MLNSTTPPAEFPAGIYTVHPDLDELLIRWDTSTRNKPAGAFHKNDKFVVYQVMPETKEGIVFGRISSLSGRLKYVGLRVNANVKVVLLEAFNETQLNESERIRRVEDFLELKFGYKP